MYFFVLFALTMRRQIQCVLPFLSFVIASLCAAADSDIRRHMIKYKYIPFDLGRKARYGANRS